jgi:hypothetical protein
VGNVESNIAAQASQGGKAKTDGGQIDQVTEN